MKIKLILVLMVMIVFMASVAFAHPPKAIETKQDGNILEIKVIHIVQDPARHYIEDIEIRNEGETLVKQPFKSQETKEYQTLKVDVSNYPKNVPLKVNADCNLAGQKEIKVTLV